MHIRERFDRELGALRDDILKMAGVVEAELNLALAALDARDAERGREVYEIDTRVNAARFEIEQRCVSLLVTQQPAARDLRNVVAAMHMITDLERMGDQAKGIARVVTRLQKHPTQPQPVELKQMGQVVIHMLQQAMLAFAHENVDLARAAAAQDTEADALYARVFSQIIWQMAESEQTERVQAAYEILRAARELERFGDLASNIAERVIYMVTGAIEELNPDISEAVEE